MLSKALFRSSQQSFRLAVRSAQPAMAATPAVQARAFGHTKYQFDDEDWKPNQFQVSDHHYRALCLELAS